MLFTASKILDLAKVIGSLRSAPTVCNSTAFTLLICGCVPHSQVKLEDHLVYLAEPTRLLTFGCSDSIVPCNELVVENWTVNHRRFILIHNHITAVSMVRFPPHLGRN